jgi:nitrite reductase/ring-hydroxylating ferredoxin subunit
MNKVDPQKRAVPFRVTDPERIPSKRYYDEEFYRLECEHLWPHVWQMACRLEQIPNVGDWTEYTNLGKSVIIVRTKDGVKAFHNACRHRGVQVANGHGNCKATGFICPFHGWRYNMEGKNTFVFGKHLFSDELMNPADLALSPVRLELWSGCAFINFDDNAPSLRESIGPVTERLDQYSIDKVRAEWWYACEVPANWKTAIEAFHEGYHVMRTHPQLQAVSPSIYGSRYGRETGDDTGLAKKSGTIRDEIKQMFEHLHVLSVGMAGMCHAKDVETARGLLDVELPDDPQQAMMTWFGMLNAEVTRQGRERGEPTPDLNALAVSHPVNAVEFIFPHFFYLPFLSSFASYRCRPLGPEKCLFEIWSLTLFPEGKEPPPLKEPLMLPPDSKTFPPISQQDFENIPKQQVGLRAPSFEFMRLSKKVEGLVSNYQRIIDGYIAGADPKKLAKATNVLGGNFDGPIVEMDL